MHQYEIRTTWTGNRGAGTTGYRDEARGTMETTPEGGGRFRKWLRPRVTIARGDAGRAGTLHDDAHRLCFIASSVNFPVRHEPRLELAGP